MPLDNEDIIKNKPNKYYLYKHFLLLLSLNDIETMVNTLSDQ